MELAAIFANLLEKHNSQLRIRGSKAVGIAPCHDDTHPSFSADLAKCVWYCHACCHGGGVRDFAMLVAEEWACSRPALTRRVRHRFAAAARRREAREKEVNQQLKTVRRNQRQIQAQQRRLEQRISAQEWNDLVRGANDFYGKQQLDEFWDR